MHSKTSQIGSWFSMFVVMLMAVFGGQTAQAQSMHSMDALSQGASMSNQYAGSTLWFQFDAVGFGTQTASAVRINEHYGLAPAHLFQQPGFTFSNFRVGNGSDTISDPGQTRTIVEWGLHPSYTGQVGQGVDLAWFRWDEALAGTDVNIVPLQLGDVITYTGYGRPATPAGYLPMDGARRSFEGIAENFGSFDGGYSTDYVNSNFFPPEFSGYRPLGGVATPGSSGSGGYLNPTSLATLTSFNTGGVGYFSDTWGLVLNPYSPWVYSSIPSPGTFLGMSLGSAVLFRRRR